MLVIKILEKFDAEVNIRINLNTKNDIPVSGVKTTGEFGRKYSMFS